MGNLEKDKEQEVKEEGKVKESSPEEEKAVKEASGEEEIQDSENNTEVSDGEAAEEVTPDISEITPEKLKALSGLLGKAKKIKAIEEKNAELEDKVKRQMAEFENFRKRTEKEKAVMFEMGAKSIIEKILPVVDNFERGLDSVSDDKKTDSVYEGMSLIYKQLITELENLGVKPIEALGVEFNPDFHNAVIQEETDEFGEGIICKELQKGYTYRDTVVRHSMVAVAK